MPTQVPTTSQSITLKVAAIGGGATGERYDYTFAFTSNTNDTLTVLKRDLNDIRNLPGYQQGAFDKGLVIQHGSIQLEIIPSFEGAGYQLLKNKDVIVTSNPKLTDSPIYRINHSSIFIPQNSNYIPKTGAHYTVTFKDKVQDCQDISSSTPACVWSQGVTLQSGEDLSISCSTENEGVDWCDSIVQSLNVSVRKFSN